jgi:hypothetical protein
MRGSKRHAVWARYGVDVSAMFNKLFCKDDISPRLHVSMPDVEKLADLIVLLRPIFHLTSLGTIQGVLAYGAILELDK